ncbi:MAG: MoaD family protein [Candidatus Bipolaricaulota bacterium]
MRVEVHVYFPFRAELDSSLVVLDLPPGADVSAAVDAFVERYPQLRDRVVDQAGRPHRYVSALVNGVSIQFLRGFSTELSPSDVVTLLPPVGGG